MTPSRRSRQARVGLSQRVVERPERGERRDVLDQAWTPLVEAIGAVAVPVPNRLGDVVAWAEEMALDAILLTGGNNLPVPGEDSVEDLAPERDATEAALIDWCAATDRPLIGVCRGAQHLARRCGAGLRAVAGHVATEHELRRAEGLSADHEPLFRPGRVNSYHGFALPLAELGAELEALLLAPDGTVEAFRRRGSRQWGLLWHPERGSRRPEDQALLRALLVATKEGEAS